MSDFTDDGNTGTVVSDEARLRELAEAATPGPWQATANGRVLPPPPQLPHMSMAPSDDPVAEAQSRADAEFIAATDPTTVLSLLDARDADRAELSLLREQRDECERQYQSPGMA